MNSIKSKILLSLGTLASIATLTIPLQSPSFAQTRGSHVQMRMCAKIEYTYVKNGKKVSGVTPVKCGQKFKQQHSESPARRKSRQAACKAAWRELPKLKRGDRWVQRSCKPFQQK
ncbi:MAG: hypothetical protein ACFCUV_27475 [Rivularia sp. (in: cyanobacteria)]